MVPLDGIKLLNEPTQTLRNTFLPGRERWARNKNITNRGRRRWHVLGLFSSGWMTGQVPIYRIEYGVLIVPLWPVAGYPRHAQFFQYSRNILVLELYRAVGSSDSRHQSGAMPRFGIWLASKFRSEHDEVVGYDCIEFVILPRRAALFFFFHRRRSRRLPVWIATRVQRSN